MAGVKHLFVWALLCLSVPDSVYTQTDACTNVTCGTNLICQTVSYCSSDGSCSEGAMCVVASAASGASGTSGTDGTSGASGSSGTLGTSGTSDTVGLTGTSGAISSAVLGTGTSGTGTSGSTDLSGTLSSVGLTVTGGSTGTSGSADLVGSSGLGGPTVVSTSSDTGGSTGTSGATSSAILGTGTSSAGVLTGISGSTGTGGSAGLTGSSGTGLLTSTSGSSGLSGQTVSSTSSGTGGSTGTNGAVSTAVLGTGASGGTGAPSGSSATSTTGVTSRAGQCPAVQANDGLGCDTQCYTDNMCPGTSKCCRNACNKFVCRMPQLTGTNAGVTSGTGSSNGASGTGLYATKAGQCPAVQANDGLGCDTQCYVDNMCPGTSKCCRNACDKFVCRMPQSTATTSGSTGTMTGGIGSSTVGATGTGTSGGQGFKAGQCPAVQANDGLGCSPQCNVDTMCPGTAKCCPNSCGSFVCRMPLMTGTSSGSMTGGISFPNGMTATGTNGGTTFPSGTGTMSGGVNFQNGVTGTVTNNGGTGFMSRAGQCPAVQNNDGLGCVSQCTSDGMCSGTFKCCRNACGSFVCRQPLRFVTKAGQCPAIQAYDGLGCTTQCNTDSMCPGTAKCCRSLACGRFVCRSPTFTGMMGTSGTGSWSGGLGSPTGMTGTGTGTSTGGIGFPNGMTGAGTMTGGIGSPTGAGTMTGGGGSPNGLTFSGSQMKAGQCPAVQPNDGLGCTTQCNTDNQCQGNAKCCRNACGSFVCRMPLMTGAGMNSGSGTMTGGVGFPNSAAGNGLNGGTGYGTKAGQCPAVQANDGLGCATQCNADGQCQGTAKCCRNACGRFVCRLPQMTGTTFPSGTGSQTGGVGFSNGMTGTGSNGGTGSSTKAGQCPPVQANDGLGCNTQCYVDRMCPGTAKCCRSLACGRFVCRQPLMTGATFPSGGGTLSGGNGSPNALTGTGTNGRTGTTFPSSGGSLPTGISSANGLTGTTGTNGRTGTGITGTNTGTTGTGLGGTTGGISSGGNAGSRPVLNTGPGSWMAASGGAGGTTGGGSIGGAVISNANQNPGTGFPGEIPGTGVSGRNLVKTGQCPAVQAGARDTLGCRTTCYIDNMCPGSEKCCLNACRKYVCRNLQGTSSGAGIVSINGGVPVTSPSNSVTGTRTSGGTGTSTGTTGSNSGPTRMNFTGTGTIGSGSRAGTAEASSGPTLLSFEGAGTFGGTGTASGGAGSTNFKVGAQPVMNMATFQTSAAARSGLTGTAMNGQRGTGASGAGIVRTNGNIPGFTSSNSVSRTGSGPGGVRFNGGTTRSANGMTGYGTYRGTKPGNCPRPTNNRRSFCSNTCSSDQQCQQSLKCCFDGSCNVCVFPAGGQWANWNTGNRVASSQNRRYTNQNQNQANRNQQQGYWYQNQFSGEMCPRYTGKVQGCRSNCRSDENCDRSAGKRCCPVVNGCSLCLKTLSAPVCNGGCASGYQCEYNVCSVFDRSCRHTARCVARSNTARRNNMYYPLVFSGMLN